MTSERADRLQLPRQNIKAIETEHYDPSLRLTLKLAKLFGVPVESTSSADGD